MRSHCQQKGDTTCAHSEGEPSFRIVRIEVTRMLSKGLDVRPCKVMNTLSEGNRATRSWLISLHFLCYQDLLLVKVPSTDRLRAKAPFT